MEMIKETAKVVRQQQIDEGIFDMELSFPKGAALAKPGQFIAMYCNDKSKLLPRPISICGINKEEGTLRVVYRVAGEGTKEFSEMKEGDTLEVMGPLGNGFALKEEKAIIIGGGIGIPPMLELAKQLNVEKTVVLGYRTSTFLKDEFEAVCDVKVATEDGSQGAKGTVIDAIEKYGVGNLCLWTNANVKSSRSLCRRTRNGSTNFLRRENGMWNWRLSWLYLQDKGKRPSHKRKQYPNL